MSVNSIGISVGHQQIAKFLLSMLLSFEFSDTLNITEKSNGVNCGIHKIDEFQFQLPHKVLKDVLQY